MGGREPCWLFTTVPARMKILRAIPAMELEAQCFTKNRLRWCQIVLLSGGS